MLENPPSQNSSTPVLTRRERERLARRQEIIDAARIVFAHKGFNDATLDDVAERAEFGKGTLYNYFDNKEALFAGVLQDSFDQFLSIATATLQTTAPFTERIEAFIRGELAYLFTHPEAMYLMMRETQQMRLCEGGNPMMQLLPKLLTMLGDTIAAEQRRRKVIAHATPVELATILINMLFGQFSARFYGGLCPAKGQTNATVSNATDIFSRLSELDLDRETSVATKLITTVYFNGITR